MTTETVEIVEGIEHRVDLEILRGKFCECMNLVLDARQQKVIIRRFGLDGDNSHTLKQVGEEFNLSPQRICQIEARALRTIRRKVSRKEQPFLSLKEFLI